MHDQNPDRTTAPVLPKDLVLDPWHMLAFGFGSGLAPKAPGTFGTLAAALFTFALLDLNLEAFLVFITLMAGVGVWVCGRTARALGCHDHGAIVWDEWVGYWISLIALPLDWQTMLVAFVLFRIFDIAKPWPIRWVDRHVHGGVGIMLDDVLAGVMACLSQHALWWALSG